jgi:hypothetical protein
VGLGTVLLTYWPRRSKTNLIWVAMLLLWLRFMPDPWISPEHTPMLKYVLLLGVLTLAGAFHLTGKARPALVLLTMAGAIWLAALRFDGSFAWLTVGFPTDRYRTLAMGPTDNLPAILQHVYRWDVSDVVFGIELRLILQLLACVLIGVCAIGLARFANTDRSFLAGTVAPWVVMFTFMPQMHERYLLWGSAMSSGLIVFGIRGLLLWFGIGLVSFGLHLHQMINVTGGPKDYLVIKGIIPSLDVSDRALFRMFEGMHPHVGWGLIVISTVMLVMAMRRSDRQSS